MSDSSGFGEFWHFIRSEKKYWLAPFVIVFIVLVVLMVFSNASVIGPFIYTLF